MFNPPQKGKKWYQRYISWSGSVSEEAQMGHLLKPTIARIFRSLKLEQILLTTPPKDKFP